MIIACPSCSAPYQLRDDDVAPLVQVECPACQYRIILDFEAANDPSLVEAGTQSTNAYRDEAAYHEHVGGASAPAPAAAPARPEPAPARPAPVRAKPTPAPTPAPAPAPAPAAVAGSQTKPSLPDTATPQHTPVPAPAPGPGAATLEPAVASAPEPSVPELELDVEVEPELDAKASQAEMLADAVERAAERMPPHTPAADAPASVAPEGQEPVEDLDAGLSHADLSVESPSNTPSPTPKPEKSGSFLGKFFIFILLLVIIGAGVLVGMSYMETGDPNPMPLINDLLQKAQDMMNGLG